ncbi:Hypothetical protein, putative [Bodo saltans]|uniref:Uncharacterized protein n=1 Tax=Bodo saltans TaxID=75058 RepID=A0A0S4J074_BODSA|nr:Hypothetical protein, putative [Bodo saltans]|eukprot:CUG74693.1 Hypothetical protein, putative [Bodo saltans]
MGGSCSTSLEVRPVVDPQSFRRLSHPHHSTSQHPQLPPQLIDVSNIFATATPASLEVSLASRRRLREVSTAAQHQRSIESRSSRTHSSRDSSRDLSCSPNRSSRSSRSGSVQAAALNPLNASVRAATPATSSLAPSSRIKRSVPEKNIQPLVAPSSHDAHLFESCRAPAVTLARGEDAEEEDAYDLHSFSDDVDHNGPLSAAPVALLPPISTAQPPQRKQSCQVVQSLEDDHHLIKAAPLFSASLLLASSANNLTANAQSFMTATTLGSLQQMFEDARTNGQALMPTFATTTMDSLEDEGMVW